MNVLIDTGPLYALFDKGDQYYRWAKQSIGSLKKPLITCEPVLTEAIFLMLRSGINPGPLFEFIERGDLKVNRVFSGEQNQKQIRELIHSYSRLPCSFADACLVCMVDDARNARIFTIDSDFNIYRDQKGEPLPLIIPDSV